MNKCFINGKNCLRKAFQKRSVERLFSLLKTSHKILNHVILSGEDALIEDGFALYNLSRFFHRESRLFVRQKNGKISCQLAQPDYEGKENLIVSGLKEAEVRIYPPCGEVEKTDVIPLGESKLSKVKKKENYLYWERVSGNLRISWQKEKLCKE